MSETLESTSARASVVDSAALVVGEVVANVVRSDTDGVRLSLHLHHGQLKIEVTDSSAAGTVARRRRSSGVRGRGLVLVDALALDWGVDRVVSGDTRVWAVLAVPRELTPALECDYSPVLRTG